MGYSNGLEQGATGMCDGSNGSKGSDGKEGGIGKEGSNSDGSNVIKAAKVSK